MFDTFFNPAADKYAWVGADKAEIILLNDFCWSKELIEWKSLLLLLEGDQVNLPVPKNNFVTDVCINRNTPVFAASKSVITYRGAYNSQDQSEDDMMASRWKVFHFSNSIPESEQKNVSPCSKCFAQLVLMGEINERLIVRNVGDELKHEIIPKTSIALQVLPRILDQN